MTREKQNCGNCRFSTEQRAGRTALEFVLVCEFSPPDMIALQSQHGLQIMPVKRTVTDDVWCHQWQEKDTGLRAD